MTKKKLVFCIKKLHLKANQLALQILSNKAVVTSKLSKVLKNPTLTNQLSKMNY